MDAVLLGLASAALFGAMTVALRLALLRNSDARVGAAVTAIAALALTLAVTPLSGGGGEPRDLVLFAAAGALAPGISQLLFTLAVRDAGAARASTVVGAAPLITVALGIGVLAEPLRPAVVAGAVLVVAGGAALAWEKLRPRTFRAIGIVWALACTLLFATRDTFVRWFSGETPVASTDGAAATLLGGAIVLTAGALGRSWRRPLPFVPVGICFGLSYVCLFEAYYRGRVSVVSPLVATESLWGVGLSALLIGRSERVGRRLVLGAGLIVAGAVLIAATR
jgi:drug/metabolite transporter (DMT)-like permease